MPRVRTKPINPFIAELMAKNGISHINDLPSKFPGLSKGQVYQYADVTGDHQTFRALLRDAHALGMTADEFLVKLLGIDDGGTADTQQAS